MFNLKLTPTQSVLSVLIATLFSATIAEAATPAYVFRKPILNLVAEPANQHAILSVSPNSLAFPNTTQGQTSAGQVVTLSNTGNIAITGLSIGVTGDFGASSTCLATLNAGASCTATATFTPQAVGARSGNLAISSTNGGTASIALSGSGLLALIPSVGLSTTSLSFGTSTAQQAVTVTNSGTADLVLGTLTLGGTNPSDFTKSADTCSGATLAPAATCSVGITFVPSTTGARTAAISIPNNAAGSPHSFTVSGTGVAATFAVTGSPSTTQNFTSTNVGSQANPAITFNLQNTGNIAGSYTSPSFSGTNASEFTIGSNTCSSILGSGSCSLSVNFLPTAAGARSATATIAGTAYTFNGTANAVDPSFSSVFALLHFDNNLTDSKSPTFSVSTGSPNYVTGTSGFSNALNFPGNANISSSVNAPSLSGDFTIEFKVKFNSLAANTSILGSDAGGGNSNKWMINYGGWGNTLTFHSNNTSGTSIANSFAWTPSTGTWYSIALSRSGSSLRAFVNGTQIGSTLSMSGAVPNASRPLVIGQDGEGWGWLNGAIDEFRLTNGVARYTANYTVDSTPFPDQ